jgi:hypothetical protein
MWNRLTKIVFIATLLSNIFCTYANETNNFRISFAKGEMDEITGGTIALSFALDYPACAAFKAYLLLPDQINGSEAEFDKTGNGGDLNPTFDKNGVQVSYNGQNYKQHAITFTPKNNAISGASTGFTIINLKSHQGDKCTWELLQEILYVGIDPNECTNFQEITYSPCVLTVLPPPIRNTSVSTNIYDYSKDNRLENDPFKIVVSVGYTQGTYQSRVDSLNVEIPSGLECIGVTRSNHNSGTFYNLNNIPDSDIEEYNINDERKMISIANITANYYYAFYFKKINQDTQEFKINASVSYKEVYNCSDDINSQPTKKGGLSELRRNASTIPVDANKPYLNIPNSYSTINPNLCDKNTWKSTFFIELDAAFKGSLIEMDQSKPLFLELELKSQEDVGFCQIQLVPNEYSASSIFYENLGEDGADVPATNLNLGTDKDIKKIRIRLENISTLFSTPFSETFSLEWFTKEVPKTEKIYACSIKLSQGESSDSPEKTITLKVYSPSGQNTGNRTNRMENRIYDGDFNNILDNFAMEYNTVYSAYFQLESKYLYNNFEFSLNNLLEFVETTPIKYYYGEKSSINNVLDNEWKELIKNENYSFKTNTVNKAVIFDNLVKTILPFDDNDQCATESKYLYLLYNIKLRNDAPPTTGSTPNIYNSSLYLDRSFTNYGSSTFYVPSKLFLTPYMYAVCDETQSKNHIALTQNDNYVYKYILDNFGNQDIDKQVIMIGSFPHIGDREIINANPRNSMFNISVSSVSNIKISLLDMDDREKEEIYNGSLSDLAQNLPQGWTMQYSTASKPCLDDLLKLTSDAADCSPIWTTSIPSEDPAYYFMLTAPSLGRFTKLSVTMQGELPASVSAGQEASASVAAGISLLSGAQYYSKESEKATITIASRSDCGDAIIVNGTPDTELSSSNPICGKAVHIRARITGSRSLYTLRWYINGKEETAAYDKDEWNRDFAPGTYKIGMEINIMRGGKRLVEATLTVKPCGETPECTECPNSFAPVPGEKYVLSAWIKDPKAEEEDAGSYTNGLVELTFAGSPDVIPCVPEGAIIEGWQRIQKEFTVPESAVKMNIELVNMNENGEENTIFFDDIRVFPFNGNMKSYVYDPITMRLTAELDNENYATFYEYDEEGALIRVKKETERGIMTIREARQAKPKNK